VIPWLIAGVGLLTAFVLALSFYGSLEITRIPHFAVPYTPADYKWPFEDVHFETIDGLRLTGWFIPAKTPSSKTLIIQHGVGSNHGDMIPNTVCLYNEGRWNLLYYNFRGHADSEGQITSLGLFELRDLDAAIKFLKENKSESAKQIAIYGHSLGAAVAIVGAAKHSELEAVAAESPFAFISQTVRWFSWIYYGIPYFPFVPLAMFFTSLRLGQSIGDFAPAEEIGKISPRPILLIQGGRDIRIPMTDFQRLWAAAKEPKEKLLITEADHGDPWMIERDRYEKALVEFFRKAIP
jgi:fermentation-respiration switch protein FrsA (DUF1100 family)